MWFQVIVLNTNSPNFYCWPFQTNGVLHGVRHTAVYAADWFWWYICKISVNQCGCCLWSKRDFTHIRSFWCCATLLKVTYVSDQTRIFVCGWRLQWFDNQKQRTMYELVFSTVIQRAGAHSKLAGWRMAFLVRDMFAQLDVTNKNVVLETGLGLEFIITIWYLTKI